MSWMSLCWGDMVGAASVADSTISINSQKIASVLDPTSAQDAATKKYVDTNIGGSLETVVISQCDSTLDVYSVSSTFGALILPSGNLSIKTLKVYCYQGGSGNVQGAIYDASTNARVDVTDSVSVATTGIKTMTFATSVSLTKGGPYYLAVSCTANGSLFVGNNYGPASFNPSPKPSFVQTNNRLPATLSPSADSRVVWIAAFTE